MAAYSPEHVFANCRPTPDHAKLVLPSDVKDLVEKNKSNPLLTTVDTLLQKAVDECLPFLAAAHSHNVANGMLNALFIQVAHLLWGKKLAPVFPLIAISTGKPTEDKVTVVFHEWVRWADAEAPDSNIAAAAGFQPRPDQRKVATAETVNLTFDLPTAPEEAYKVGGQVVVVRRFTRTVPIKDNPLFRVDF